MKPRVLVVDDDAPVRESLKKVLQQAGYEVLLAAGAAEALERRQSGAVDLLLLDLCLPGRSGWELLEELRAMPPLAPVILITALPNQARAARAARVGALLEKPIEVPVLLKTIEELLPVQLRAS